MQQSIRVIVSVAFIFASLQISAQNNAMYQLEKVKLADFNPQSPVIDSNANAVVLADIGSSEFEDNAKGDFFTVYKRSKRILIRNKNAFDLATVKIPIYVGRTIFQEESFEDFEATTYNLENGKIVATSIDIKSVFKEDYNTWTVLKKFTLSNIKEGCIIEYKYAIKSPFSLFHENLRSWQFQGKYPVLWSQYHIIVPPMFSYAILRQGNVPYTIDTTKDVYKTFRVLINGDAYNHDELYRFSGDSKYHLWAIKNAPAIKEEKYAPEFTNYITKIDFPLYSIHYTPSSPTIEIIKRWPDAIDKLLHEPDYAYTLNGEMTPWLKEDLKQFDSMMVPYDKAKAIYNYVRDNYKCRNHDASVWLSETIKKTFQNKSGTVTDINMILMAMLAHEGFDVQPVILSTIDNGYVTEEAPIIYQYNYVIARLKVDTSYFLLDASVPKLGFGKLPTNCYNQSARVLNDSATLIPLSNNDITETKSTVVFIGNDEKGDITGTYNSTLGDSESFDLRNNFKDKPEENYKKAVAKNYTSDIEINSLQLEALKDYETPITVHYDFKLNTNNAGVLYVNPLLSDAILTNPFSAADRLFPIELPYKTNHVYTLNLEVPKGYTIDEMPKPTRIKLNNNNDGVFEYLTAVSGTNIQLRSKLILNKAVFSADDYQNLRNFFALIVKKQAEQIVFKKAK